MLLLITISGYASNTLSSSGYFGVPSPVVGSQPRVAEKPSVPHPGALPEVISLKIWVFLYSVGLMKPTGPLPFAVRSSLIIVIKDAQIGVASEVPHE